MHLIIVIRYYLLSIFGEGHPARCDSLYIASLSSGVVVSGFVEEGILIIEPAQNPLLLIMVDIPDVSIETVVQGLSGDSIYSSCGLFLEFFVSRVLVSEIVMWGAWPLLALIEASVLFFESLNIILILDFCLFESCVDKVIFCLNWFLIL